MIKRMLIIWLFACGLAGCAAADSQVIYKTQQVDVQVPVKRQAPDELTASLKLDLPAFIAPADPAASSCLSPEGEKKLQLSLFDLRTRIDGWAAWYAAP